jgi:2-iminobutanoate/2-iminopropanoate deaminase
VRHIEIIGGETRDSRNLLSAGSKTHTHYYLWFMEFISTDSAPKSSLYSQAVKAGGLVFVSGQSPFDPKTGKLVGETIQEQTEQCLKNIAAILEAAGSSISKVVTATFILVNESDFNGVNEVWGRWFPINPPARQGARHPISGETIPGYRVSISVIAEA